MGEGGSGYFYLCPREGRRTGGEGSVVLWGKRVTNAISDMAVFEWSGAVFSPLPFAVAVQIVPSPGAPCAQLVNFTNREAGEEVGFSSWVILFCSSWAVAKEATLDRGTLECVFSV